MKAFKLSIAQSLQHRQSQRICQEDQLRTLIVRASDEVGSYSQCLYFCCVVRAVLSCWDIYCLLLSTGVLNEDPWLPHSSQPLLQTHQCRPGSMVTQDIVHLLERVQAFLQSSLTVSPGVRYCTVVLMSAQAVIASHGGTPLAGLMS